MKPNRKPWFLHCKNHENTLGFDGFQRDVKKDYILNLSTFPLAPKNETIIWEEEFGRISLGTRENEKCYHEWQTHFYVFLERGILYLPFVFF